MLWFFFVIIAVALWAVNNIIDKIIITKYAKSGMCYAAITNSLTPLAAIVIFFSFKIQYNAYAWLGIFLGFAGAVTYLLYFRALKHEETSRVSMLMRLIPVFTILFAVIFLGEKLSLLACIGSFFLISGAALISYKRTAEKWSLSKALLMILLFDILFAVYGVATKYAVDNIDYVSFLFWTIIGTIPTIFLFLSFKEVRKRVKIVLKNYLKEVAILTVIVTILYYCAEASYYYALTIGTASLSSAVASAQTLFVLIFALIMSTFFPKILKENIDKKSLVLKFAAIVLIIIGGVLALGHN